MSYRSADASSPNVESVHYFPLSVGTLVLVGALFALVPITLVYQAAQVGRAIEVSCNSGTCDIRKDYGVFATHDRILQRDIRSVRVFQRSNKGGLIYGVDLVLANDDTVTVRRAGAKGDANSVRDAVHRIVQRSGAIESQQASPETALLFGTLGVAFCFVYVLFTRSARLHFHLDRGRIEYERQRWPLPHARRTFRLDEVRDATVIEQTGSKGGKQYVAALTLRGAEPFVLVPNAGGDRAKAEAAVDQINGLLARMRDPGL